MVICWSDIWVYPSLLGVAFQKLPGGGDGDRCISQHWKALDMIGGSMWMLKVLAIDDGKKKSAWPKYAQLWIQTPDLPSRPDIADISVLARSFPNETVSRPRLWPAEMQAGTDRVPKVQRAVLVT
ncbi:hypothetical protein SAY87_028936 [Trapa incisa]|uniref:Uncharacterized protein n=1 Tax=Trapa incisa TaxID=236973 RepID=A0AAN7L3T0_9MYRT|nr:hypothetical protein SAY87_028936 [Trapa incisa]